MHSEMVTSGSVFNQMGVCALPMMKKAVRTTTHAPTETLPFATQVDLVVTCLRMLQLYMCFTSL